MKSLLTVIKYTALAALLVAMAFGYLFFRVWQSNQRPLVTESSWDQSEILLGHSSTLTLSLEVPWHRELETASPIAFPEFLQPIHHLGEISKGSLNLKGYRNWRIQIPFVATSSQQLGEQSATFSVKPTKRISPNSINLKLPELTISLPPDVPESPVNSDRFLTEEIPKLAEKSSVAQTNTQPLWQWLLGTLILILVFFHLLKRTGVIRTTPAWEKALGRLDSLSKDAPPPIYYSRLTDILKSYTADRYRVKARAKTSAELIQSLQKLPTIPPQYLRDLPEFARLADAVKFAEHQPQSSDFENSFHLVRSFIKATIPVENNQPPND